MQIFSQGLIGLPEPFLHADYVSASTGGFLIYNVCPIVVLIGIVTVIVGIIYYFWRRKQKKKMNDGIEDNPHD